MSSDFVQLQTTVDSREAADDLALRIVEAGLAACVQALGPIGSTCRWEGEMESAAAEWLLLMKTTQQLTDPLLDFVRDRHPYDGQEPRPRTGSLNSSLFRRMENLVINEFFVCPFFRVS